MSLLFGNMPPSPDQDFRGKCPGLSPLRSILGNYTTFLLLLQVIKDTIALLLKIIMNKIQNIEVKTELIML
jgi:hypothetical protein